MILKKIIHSITLWSLIFSLLILDLPLTHFVNYASADDKSTTASQELRDEAAKIDTSADANQNGESLSQVVNTNLESLSASQDKIEFKSEAGLDYALLIIQNLTLVAIAIAAGSLIVLCKNSFYLVPSVGLFVSTAIAWLLAEISFYATYQILSMEALKKFKYDNSKDKQRQFSAAEEIEKNAEKLHALLTAQAVIYTTLAAGFAGATTLAGIEALTQSQGKKFLQGRELDLRLANKKLSAETQVKLTAPFTPDKSPNPELSHFQMNAMNFSNEVEKILLPAKLETDSACSQVDVSKTALLTSTTTKNHMIKGNTDSLYTQLEIKIKSILTQEIGETALSKARLAMAEGSANPQQIAQASAELVKETKEDQQNFAASKVVLAQSNKIVLSVKETYSKLEILEKFQKNYARIKKHTFLECPDTEKKCDGNPHNEEVNKLLNNNSSPQKIIYALISTLASLIFPRSSHAFFDMASLLTPAGLKNIFIFIDMAAIGIVVILVAKYRAKINRHWVHPITRAIVYGLSAGLATITVSLISGAALKAQLRVSEMRALKKKIRGDIDGASNKQTENEQAPNSNQGGTIGSSGAGGTQSSQFQQFGSGAENKLTTEIDWLQSQLSSGENCIQEGSGVGGIGALDPKCDCLKSNSCAKSQVSPSNEEITKHQLASGIGVVSKSISGITDSIGKGDLRTAFNIANSDEVRSAMAKVRNNFKKHKALIDKVQGQSNSGGKINIDEMRKNELSDLIDAAKKENGNNPSIQNLSENISQGNIGIEDQPITESIESLENKIDSPNEVVAVQADDRSTHSLDNSLTMREEEELQFENEKILDEEALSQAIDEGQIPEQSVSLDNSANLFNLITNRYQKVFILKRSNGYGK